LFWGRGGRLKFIRWVMDVWPLRLLKGRMASWWRQ
jgi:hypothetical protein